jgi:hypothetical protein
VGRWGMEKAKGAKGVYGCKYNATVIVLRLLRCSVSLAAHPHKVLARCSPAIVTR